MGDKLKPQLYRQSLTPYQMVHLKLNERRANPNPHINFISVLPTGYKSQEDAMELLRALAAQVRPIMKTRGLTINSLEEYEYNTVFAGRNCNNGETIELVLRNKSGYFYPNSWLMSTFCHELAHNVHMNHGPEFQALWRQLRTEVRELQERGYYGDGYWSGGIRLSDSAKILAPETSAGSYPEYLCGGAQSRSRTSTKRRRAFIPKDTTSGPSVHSGMQTEKKRKAGTRIRSGGTFTGSGFTLNDGIKGEGIGTGFGKKAQSKRARDERAAALEKRIKILKPETKPETKHDPGHDSPVGSDSDYEATPETDADRRRVLLEAGDDPEKHSWLEFTDDFSFRVLDPSSGGEQEKSCDLARESGGTTNVIGSSNSSFPKAEIKASLSRTKPIKPKSTGKQNSTLDSFLRKGTQNRDSGALTTGKLDQPSSPQQQQGDSDSAKTRQKWSCLACTLINMELHLACDACGTPREQEQSCNVSET